MPNTYTLIKGETLTTAAASYAFTAIPSTYTDLVIRWSARDTSNFGDNFSNARMQINAFNGTEYSQTDLRGKSTTVSSARLSSSNYWFLYNSYNLQKLLQNHFLLYNVYSFYCTSLYNRIYK